MKRWTLFLLFVIALPATSAGIFDPLNSDAGWNPSSDTQSGYVDFSKGFLSITRFNTVTGGHVGVEKDYWATVPQNTWFHVLIRQPQGGAVGGNMYTTISINNVPALEFNVNGDEHWYSLKDICTAKVYDDSFHISMAADNHNILDNVFNTPTWTNDVPVRYPANVNIPYSKWTLYSVRYFIDTNGVTRWRFYVDGQEISYRDIGYTVPQDFQNVATVTPSIGLNKISFRLSAHADGDLYSEAKHFGAADQKSCHFDSTPFIHDGSGYKAVSTEVNWKFILVGNAQQGDFDVNLIKPYIYDGVISTSTAVVTDMIPWNQAQFNCRYISYDEIKRVREIKQEASDFCVTRIKDDIYAGTLKTSDAVVQGLISPTNAEFNCPYVSYDEIKQVRASTSTASNFCVNRIKNDIYAGLIRTADAVTQGLISWQNTEFNCPYLDDQEKYVIRHSSSDAANFCMTPH